MDTRTIIYSFVAFFLVAFSKGLTGWGLSMFCLPMLAMMMPSTVSISLVIVHVLLLQHLNYSGDG